MVNENNYDGAHATIVGRAGGEWSVREFGNGNSQAELSIAVGKGYKDKATGEWVDQGTDWYRLISTPDYATQNWPEVGPGDKVRVEDARQEVRSYIKNDGTAAHSIDLRFGTLTVVQAKQPVGAGVEKPF